MDKMREEFERWAVGAGYWTKMVVDESDGCSVAIYANGQTRSAWQAWQASRKSLVVELPNAWEDGCELVMNAHRVRMELERAGVSYE